MKVHGLQSRKNPHPLFKTWCEMRYRCENPRKHNYKHYGGRGIMVCTRWLSFENFVADMGARPAGTTLDRIDPNGHYEPKNCRWATKETQMNNMRSNRLLVVYGETKTMSEWSKIWKVPVGTIWMRLKLGWGVEDAVKRTVASHKPYQKRAEGKAYS